MCYLQDHSDLPYIIKKYLWLSYLVTLPNLPKNFLSENKIIYLLWTVISLSSSPSIISFQICLLLIIFFPDIHQKTQFPLISVKSICSRVKTTIPIKHSWIIIKKYSSIYENLLNSSFFLFPWYSHTGCSDILYSDTVALNLTGI